MKPNIWTRVIAFFKHHPKVTPKDIKTKAGRKKIWRVILIWSVYALLALIIFIGLAFVWFAKDLPTPNNIANRKPTMSTKIYDRTGTILLYEAGDQKRTIITSADIPQTVKDATVAAEDTRFYQHNGFDTRGIFMALYEKITGKTRVTRGGSTITQQYVKNSFLTADRSLIRKFKELILSIELEAMYSKDQILTMYLNEIPYGNNTGGIEAASQMYYGKPAKELDLAQSATLVAIPQSPTRLSPYGTHLDQLVERRNYVLNQMVKIGKITVEQADEAKKEDTTTLGTVVKPKRESMKAPHFAMYVLNDLAEKYGDDKIQKEGLRVVTTLDMDKQKVAEDTIANNIKQLTSHGANNAALVSVDPKTGQVLAMIGSKNYFDTTIDGNVNVADSRRQPGSSWKPIVYSTLFKGKYSPSSTIFDLTTDFGGGYIPHDADEKNRGPLTARQSLANSLNIPAIKSVMVAGIDNTIKTAVELGITGIDSAAQRKTYGASFGIGVAEVKPIDMANAFSAFANGGYKSDITSVLQVYDANNKLIYDNEKEKAEPKKVLEPEIAYEIASMMSDNDARALVFGSRSALYFPDRTVAAKTGTTSDNKDAWTVGYTPSLSTAIWVGNTRGEPMKVGTFGSDIAGPIFHQFMVGALKSVPNEDFVKPSTIQTLTVARYSNKLPSDTTTETITDIFAPWQIPTEKDDSFSRLNVCSNDGKLAPAGATSSLIVEKIFANIHSEMPNNSNWENPVRGWLINAGFALDPPTETCDLSAVAPSISITSPKDQSTVTGSADITVSVNTAISVNQVEIKIDNISVATLTTAPYSATYNFDSLSGGNHTITAIITDGLNKTASTSIAVSTPEKVIPIVITGVEATNITATSATINWTTNSPGNSHITYWKVTAPSQKLTADSETLTKTHTLSIASLSAAATYIYTVGSTNSQGTITSPEKSFTTPATL
ncbi:MAG: transglycosylase domain-containing protein [Candidatus Berkelbacteria bacterium]